MFFSFILFFSRVLHTIHVFFKLLTSQNTSKINQDLQTQVAAVYCRERTLPRDEWHDFVQKNLDSHICSRKHNLYSLV